jgi:hypothetical protein
VGIAAANALRMRGARGAIALACGESLRLVTRLRGDSAELPVCFEDCFGAVADVGVAPLLTELTLAV